MKKGLIYIVMGVVCSLVGYAQTPESRRFEVETGVYTLRIPSPDNNGWTIRQQLTGYVTPRLGVAIGLAWGASANTDPFKAGQNPSYFADVNRVAEFYRRNQQMMDLSLVALPILSRRHQLKVQAGLSVFRRREIGIDSLVDYGSGSIEAVLRYTETRRIVPLAGAGYDFRLSSRWAIGANVTAYFTSGSQPTTTLGARVTYRFGLSADSLGMKPVQWDELRAGVRLGASVVGRNGQGPADHYKTRFVGGLWAEMPISLTWAVRGEINYAQRGYRIDEVKQGYARYLTRTVTGNYLETPLLFRHEIAYRWHLYGGPYLAFFLSGKSETESKPDPAVQPHTNSGLMLGASYNLTNKLSVDVRYQRDLIQISTTPYGGFHSFQATLGWAFR